MKYILMIAAIFGLDYTLKEGREEHREEFTAANENIKVMTYHNHGAFLNLGDKNPLLVKFISILLTAVMTLIFLITLGRHGKTSLKLGLSCLLGGAFSNTYDRLKRQYVVDYLNFPKAPGKLKNVVFNISDFFILIGSLITLLSI